MINFFKISHEFVQEISSLKNKEDISNLIQKSFFPLLLEKFEIVDIQKIKYPFSQETKEEDIYTLLIGLSEDKITNRFKTCLSSSEEKKEISPILKGDALLFGNDYYLSNPTYRFYSWENPNEILKITLKETYYPFQIIFIEGEYNDKNFSKKFLSLENNFSLDNKIKDYVSQIKNRLNVKYREELISSKVLSSKRENFPSEVDIQHKKEFSKESIFLIQNFFENYPCDKTINTGIFYLVNKISDINYIEEVENRWDERGDGRPDIEYDEITFFKGNIKIFYFKLKVPDPN